MKKVPAILFAVSFLLLIGCGDSSSVPFSSDTSLLSEIGQVDGLSVINIPFETALSDFSNGITVAETTEFFIYETDGITEATDLKDTYRITVIAEDDSSETYIISVLPDPAIVGNWGEFDPDSADYEIVGAEIVEGISGNALSFNDDPGINNYMLYPDSEELTLSDSGYLEVWAKASSINKYAGIISKGQSKTYDDEAYGIQLYSHEGSDARLLFFLYGEDGNWIGIHGTFDIEVDTWYHLVATWDSETMYLYVNGIEDGSMANTTGGVRDTDGGITIGAQLAEQYNDSYGNFGWHGLIDEVTVGNVLLTPEEITERYNDLNL